jgi:hypothetical protein
MDNLILNLLLNIKSFFSKGSATADLEMNFRELSDEGFMEFEIRVSGISLNDALINEIDLINYGHAATSEAAGHSILHTVKHMVMDHHGKLHFSIHHNNEVFVHVLIPRLGEKPNEKLQ